MPMLWLLLTILAMALTAKANPPTFDTGSTTPYEVPDYAKYYEPVERSVGNN